MFTTLTIRDTATALAAALIGTTTLIAMSASPAHAAPATKAAFVTQVERQIADDVAASTVVRGNERGVAIVAVRIDTDGRIVRADIARSSGLARFDAEALRSATSVAYPKGTAPRLVSFVLTFGDAIAPSRAESARVASRYTNAKGEALAAETPASPNG